MINTSKLIDLNQIIFIPITDETKGGLVREEQATIGEFFNKFLDEFEPEVVDAIPIKWLESVMKKLEDKGCNDGKRIISALIDLWYSDRWTN